MNLLLFNLKTDADDDVLGFTTDWINALALHFDRIFVITMYAGRVAVAHNVRVFSVGKEKGYSEPRRFLEFYRILIKLLRTERVDACFAHMMPLFVVMGWCFLRLKNIPIVLWYGHKATPWLLRLAHWLVDRVVTSTPAGFRLKSRKVTVIGQGISENKFGFHPRMVRNKPFVVISVARLSPIKHIESMILAVGEIVRMHGPGSIRLILLGDAVTNEDLTYKLNLQLLTKEHSLDSYVYFAGAVPHHEVRNWLAQADVSINLAPDGAIDKAVLESLAMGLPVVVQNRSFAELFEKCGVAQKRFITPDLKPDTIARVISGWMLSDPIENRKILETLSANVLESHGLAGLAKRLSTQIKGLVN